MVATVATIFKIRRMSLNRPSTKEQYESPPIGTRTTKLVQSSALILNGMWPLIDQLSANKKLRTWADNFRFARHSVQSPPAIGPSRTRATMCGAALNDEAKRSVLGCRRCYGTT